MTKYYLDGLIVDVNKLSKLKYNEKYENLILTNSFLIKSINDDYFKFIIKIKEPNCIENFIGDMDMFIDDTHFKKSGIIHQIPMDHTIVKVKYAYYKNNNSNTCFVIEFIDKKIIDYYFKSTEKIEIIHNDVSTLLKTIN
tara:strand:- start:210 stop:629 length:420 start_codon:yes stop_codon:yes gene_type:complete